jgi:potassium-transporting ATPase KdpC subunit
MSELLRPAFVLLLGFSILCGAVYPAFVWSVAQTAFPQRANGSLIERDGKAVGSALIGQGFEAPRYFHPRPSAAGDGYDGASSSGSNLGPTSAKLMDRVAAAIEELGGPKPVPADAALASASGLDPHISPANAARQTARVAAARGLPEARVLVLVAQFTQGRELGILGEPRVNVLALNLALDALRP